MTHFFSKFRIYIYFKFIFNLTPKKENFMAKSDATRPEVSEADPQRNKKYAEKYQKSEQCLTCIVSNIYTNIAQPQAK